MVTAEAESFAVRYGDSTIEYTVSYAPRKTLGITVHPNLRVTVSAPEGSDLALVQQKVKKRAPWILRQQRDFRRYSPDYPPRQYVSGETHRYLGRQYRLKVVESRAETVRLSRGLLTVHLRDRNDRDRVKTLLDKWYRKRAEQVFRERLDACFGKMTRWGVAYPELVIRVMQSRWGSCTSSGRILLNVKLIQVPKQFIDYVILHELGHLVEHHHGPAFYALLDRVMPKWREVKRELEEFEWE